MNILQIQARLKDLSDQQLQQIMQQGGAGMAPEYLVLAELNRRAGMRQAQTASQPVNDTTVAQEVMAAPGLPQAVSNQMAQAMRPEGAQQSTARFAEGGIVGLQEGGFPPIPVPKPDYVATAPEQAGGFPPLPVPKPDYVAMTPEEAEIKQSITDFVEGLQAQYGADVGTGTETGALDDTDRRFMEALGITDPGKGVTFLPMSDVRVGQRLGSNGMQDFGAALDPLFRLGYDQNRISYANDISGPGDLTSLLAYSPQGYSDPGVTFPSDTVLSSPGFDQARPALAHEFRHRGLQKLADKYSGSSNEALAGEITPYKNVYRSNISDLSRVLRAAAPGRDFNRSLEEAFIESYDSPQDVIPYPPEVRYSPFVTMADTIDHPEVRRAFLGRDATRGGSGHSEREYVNYLAAKMLSDQRAQKYEEAFGRPIPPEMLNDYRVNELGLPPVGAKRFGLFSTDYIESFKPRNYAEGGIVQGYEGGGAIGKGIDGVTYPTALPQPKPAGVNYRVSEPSAMDLERLRQFEEKYGSIPEATAPTQDRQSWSDWFFGLINPRSDAQRARDAYVPTVEDSNMFGYAEGGIVQAYEDGGLTGPGWMEERFGKGQLTDMAAGPATPIGPYLQQGAALGLTADQSREAYARNIPLEGLGEYKLGFVDSPRELDIAPIVAPLPPTPVVTPTAKAMPAAPAVVTPPTPTVAAPSVSLPAATPLQVAPAPKFDEKAYTQAVSSFGVPGGVSDLTRESRRNAMLALAKAGFTLAGSKEVTAGGAIGEAAKTGIAAYEAGAKDIAAQKEARRKEGIAQARQQMLDRRAMSQEQYKRYMDTVEAQQAAAARGDTRAYRNASLELQKYGIDAAMARADMSDRAAQAREAAAADKLELEALQDELARLNGPMVMMGLEQLPKAQRTTALEDIKRRKEQIQARLDAFTGVSGIAGPPTPGVIDLTK